MWGLNVNPSKSSVQWFSRERGVDISIKINDVIISCVQEQKLLGVILDMPLLTGRQHIQYIISDGYRRVDLMKALSSTSWGASSKILRLFYVAYIQSKMEYASVMFTGVVTLLKHKLKVIQNIYLRLMLGARNTTPIR